MYLYQILDTLIFLKIQYEIFLYRLGYPKINNFSKVFNDKINMKGVVSRNAFELNLVNIIFFPG